MLSKPTGIDSSGWTKIVAKPKSKAPMPVGLVKGPMPVGAAVTHVADKVSATKWLSLEPPPPPPQPPTNTDGDDHGYVVLPLAAAPPPPPPPPTPMPSASTAAGLPAVKWPDTRCSVCCKVDHWRTMMQQRICVKWQSSKDEPEDEYLQKHTCIPCVAKEQGITEEEAKRVVYTKPMNHNAKRASQYTEALEKDRERFEAMGATRSQRHTILKQTMIDLFSPLSKHILRKRAAMERVVRDVARHNVLVEQLAQCTCIEDEHEILQEMEELEQDKHYLAFEGKEDQHLYILASSYSDVWTQIKDAKGRVIGGINSWYPCFAHTAYADDGYTRTPCCRVTPSKEWDRKNSDPLAKGQVYYCSCHARYNHKWGQIVELTRTDKHGKLERMYMRACVPHWDAEDVRAMYYEEELKPRSPQELYQAMKSVMPVLSDVIVKDDAGHVKIVDEQTFLDMPEFGWSEIFNMVGLEAPPVKTGKKNKNKRKNK